MNDFIIIIDTREQDEYKFKSILTVRDKLNTGDYSLRGFENDITIERKSLGDFISSISHGRDRFKSELARMKDYDTRASFMWSATLALNNLIGCGVPQDWSTHMIGHELTAF